jgi:hypothetical protein
MPTSLLETQFATLQEPGEEEHPIVVSTDARPSDIVELIISRLEIDHGSLKQAKPPSGQRHGANADHCARCRPWE